MARDDLRLNGGREEEVNSVPNGGLDGERDEEGRRGVGTTDPVTPRRDRDNEELDPLFPVPDNAYRRLKFDNTSLRGIPISETFASRVNLTTAEKDISYRWQGNIIFEAGEYTFVAEGPDGIRVSVGGNQIIDSWRNSSTRTETTKKEMPEGKSLVEVEWYKVRDRLETLNFTFSKKIDAVVETWISCEDGQEREGLPPSGWIQTEEGCWKSPITDDDELDLLDLIQIQPSYTEDIRRTYISDSGASLVPHHLQFYNRTTNLPLLITLSGPEAVIFTYSTAGDFGGDVVNGFELSPVSTVLIDVNFIRSVLDTLPEGINQSNILIDVVPGAIDDPVVVVPPLPPDPPPVGVIPIPPEVLPPPVVVWCDASTSPSTVREGTPPPNWIRREDGCYVPPAPTISITLSITSIELAPQLVGGRSIGRSSLVAVLSGDDPMIYSYSWDFDGENQGVGTGLSTARATEASWIMTDTDLRALENRNIAQTTRTVEVIARKGSDAYRIRKTIILRKPTRSVPPPDEDRVPDGTGTPRRTTTVIKTSGGGTERDDNGERTERDRSVE